MIDKDLNPPEEVNTPDEWDKEKCEQVLWQAFTLSKMQSGGHQDKQIVIDFEDFVSEEFHLDTFNFRSLVIASIENQISTIARLSEEFARSRMKLFLENKYNRQLIQEQFDERLDPFYSPSDYSEE